MRPRAVRCGWLCQSLEGLAHDGYSSNRGNLGGAYGDAGRLDEAIPLLERTLADRERVLGETHPGTLNSRSNLASAYQAAGRLDEAESLRNRAEPRS